MLTEERREPLRKVVVAHQAGTEIDANLQIESALAPLTGLADGFPHHEVHERDQKIFPLEAGEELFRA